MRQANGANPKPCTYNRTTQQGTKSDFKNHKNEKQAFLKSDMVNYKRKRYNQLGIHQLVPSDKLLRSHLHVNL